MEERVRFDFDYINTFLQEKFLEQLALSESSFFMYEMAPDEKENDSRSDLEQMVNRFSELSSIE